MDESTETLPPQRSVAWVVWALIIVVLAIMLITVKLLVVYPTEPLAPGPVPPTSTSDVS
jgi:hypothetical protein